MAFSSRNISEGEGTPRFSGRFYQRHIPYDLPKGVRGGCNIDFGGFSNGWSTASDGCVGGRWGGLIRIQGDEIIIENGIYPYTSDFVNTTWSNVEVYIEVIHWVVRMWVT